eukprot:s2103_g6.t1
MLDTVAKADTESELKRAELKFWGCEMLPQKQAQAMAGPSKYRYSTGSCARNGHTVWTEEYVKVSGVASLAANLAMCLASRVAYGGASSPDMAAIAKEVRDIATLAADTDGGKPTAVEAAASRAAECGHKAGKLVVKALAEQSVTGHLSLPTKMTWTVYPASLCPLKTK